MVNYSTISLHIYHISCDFRFTNYLPAENKSSESICADIAIVNTCRHLIC